MTFGQSGPALVTFRSIWTSVGDFRLVTFRPQGLGLQGVGLQGLAPHGLGVGRQNSLGVG